MNNATQRFVAEMAAAVPCIQTAVDDCFAEWDPEQPPITTLFEALADVIVLQVDTFDELSKARVFALIEEGVSTSDDELGTAVATGLIEGVVGASAHEGGNWTNIRTMLGKHSRAHADAWMAH